MFAGPFCSNGCETFTQVTGNPAKHNWLFCKIWFYLQLFDFPRVVFAVTFKQNTIKSMPAKKTTSAVASRDNLTRTSGLLRVLKSVSLWRKNGRLWADGASQTAFPVEPPVEWVVKVSKRSKRDHKVTEKTIVCLRWGVEEWWGGSSFRAPARICVLRCTGSWVQADQWEKTVFFPEPSWFSGFCFPNHFAFINCVIQN